MIPVISIVGYADSGKTTLVVKMVRILKERGYRVAALKHAHHGYAVDARGKDSDLYYEAGADKVILAGPGSITVHERLNTSLNLADICAKIDDVDLIIVEGFKREPGPKVGVYRDGYSVGLVVDGLIAVVSDRRLEMGVPCFAPDQMDELVEFILAYLSAPAV